MLSLAEIEAAADALAPEQQRELWSHLAARLGGMAPPSPGGTSNGKNGHSVLDIPTVNLGKNLRPFSADDDLLEEMLEGRHF